MQILRKFTIKFRLIILLVVSILLYSSILLYTSRIFAEFLVKKNLYNYLESTQKEIGVGIEFTLDNMTATCIRLLENDNIYNLLSEKSANHYIKQKNLSAALRKLSINKEIIGEIYIITNDGYQYNYLQNNNLQKPDAYYINKIKNSHGTFIWDQIKKDSSNNSYIVAGTKYRNFFTGQDLGCLVVYIKESAIYNIYKKKTPYSGYSFLISGQDNIISHPNKSKVGSLIFDSTLFKISKNFAYYSKVINGKSSIISISKFDDRISRLNCYWKIVSIINENNLFSVIKKINYTILIMGLVISIFAILISINLSSRIVGPIKLLKKKLKNFGKGDVINLSFYEKTGDEIWELEQSYNEMIIRINDLMQKSVEEEKKQRELELIALQAQINPHFLYNTLDAIGWIAKLKKQKDIEKLVLALAGFFRISLHKGDKFITLAEEIDLVKSFVTIELIRFPDRFDINFEVDESILDIRLLKITLQPIVENAIKHGLSPKAEKGHIDVKCYIDNDSLFINVIDDGVGFDVEKALTQPHDISNAKYNGYGIKNVDERIKLEYGPNYGITINSVISIGTNVQIKLGMLSR